MEKLEGCSGADIENIIEEATFIAFERRETGNAKITKNDIMKTAGRTPKSVTPEEVEQIEKWAKERGIKI